MTSKDVALSLREMADKLPKQPVHLGLLQQALRGGAADIEQLRAQVERLTVENRTLRAMADGKLQVVVEQSRHAVETPTPLTASSLDTLIVEADKYILPVDVKIGAATFRKGVKVGTMLRGLKSHAERQIVTAYSSEEPTARRCVVCDATSGFTSPLNLCQTCESAMQSENGSEEQA